MWRLDIREREKKKRERDWGRKRKKWDDRCLDVRERERGKREFIKREKESERVR